MQQKQVGSLANFWFTLRPLLLIGLFIFLSIYTNEVVIDYRMREFNRAMETLSQKYNASHTLSMLARFDLIRHRKDLPDEDEAALELKMRALSATAWVDTASASQHALGDRVVGAVIGAVNFLLGKHQTLRPVSVRTRKDLEVGFVYEQARKYDQAIRVYTRVLDGGGTGPDLQATLLLHRGFCLSLLSEYDLASGDFRRVETVAPGSEESETAKRFLATIQNLQQQLELAKKTRQSPLAYGRQLLQLADYTGALEQLGKALSQPELSSADRLEGRYLYARAQEEVGFDSSATAIYQELLKDHPESPFARKASRRLYLLGRVYENDKQLEQEALKKIKQYQDVKFLDRLQNFTRVQLPENPLSAAKWHGLQSMPEKELSLPSDKLEKVNDSTLTQTAAPPTAPKPREEAVALRADKIAEAEKAELRAQRAHARRIQEDPLRREAILQVLSENQGELEFLYQKWLRKGAVFEGDLTVRIYIEPSGAVGNAEVVAEKSTITVAPFIADILQNLRRWKFEPDPGAHGDLPVTFPLHFVSKQ